MLTEREQMLARKAAKRFLPTKLEDVMPELPAPPPRKPLVRGVYKHGSRWRANIRQPDGSWKQQSFATEEEAAAVREQSLKQPTP